jgi:uncharacterized protein
MAEGSRSLGPVVPTAGAAVAHRPVDGPGSLLPGGLLYEWQRRNREVSLPLALTQLEVAGNLANVRLATSERDRELPARAGHETAEREIGYRGPVFMDSDIFKTLEAIGWEPGRAAPHDATTEQDPADFAAKATALLAKAQQPDGYLNSFVQVTGAPRYASLASSHELYCAGHLIQAAIASRRGQESGWSGELFQVAQRFADHLVASFLGTDRGLDGHPIIEMALAELYRQTGDGDYLRLAAQFVDRRGYGLIGDSHHSLRYLQDHVPVRMASTEEGHVVRALYLESGVVDVAVETGDRDLLRSSIARWEDMVAAKTYLTGGNGSRHASEGFGDRYELPPDRAYNETCAAIASFQWSWRLLLATGDAKYADLMERVLYNALAAAISTSGDRFFYVNPLQRRSDHFEEDDPGRRSEWFSCACCPPNIMRFLATLQHYLATTTLDDTLYLHHFTAADVTANLGTGAFQVVIETGYPWSGDVRLTVKRPPAGQAGLAIRVPGWPANTRVEINGDRADIATDAHGYLVVRREWRLGDVFSAEFALAPRLVYPSRRIDALRGTVAVERGPLVYCFEQADQPDGVPVDDLALRAPGDDQGLCERQATLPGIGPTVLIETAAERLPPVPPSAPPYAPRRDQPAPPDPVTAIAIPYFQWDNRDGQAMRTWMPLAPAAEPTATGTDREAPPQRSGRRQRSSRPSR